MPRYLGVHKLPADIRAEEIREGWDAYRRSAESKGLKTVGAVYSLEKGFAYCQTDAASAEEVRSAHEKANIPIEDVIEIQRLD